MAIGLAMLGAGAAWADPALYTLTGMGTGVAGTSKCATYQITIDLTVDGKAVKGSFKQQGRPERAFAAGVHALAACVDASLLGESLA